MPGTVVRVLVTEGDTVSANDAVVVLEAMKMEHSVVAPYAGTVTHLHVGTGDSVDSGTVLAVVEEVD
jgi:biotin carboxyl carrier protein